MRNSVRHESQGWVQHVAGRVPARYRSLSLFPPSMTRNSPSITLLLVRLPASASPGAPLAGPADLTSERRNHQARIPRITAQIARSDSTTRNAKKPSTTEAAIASAPTTITRALAIGLPAGNPLLDEKFNVGPYSPRPGVYRSLRTRVSSSRHPRPPVRRTVVSVRPAASSTSRETATSGRR